MTDQQIVDLVLARATRCLNESDCFKAKNPKIVITQQFNKKMYFGIADDYSKIPYFMRFMQNGTSSIFMMQELPSRLMQWHDTIAKINASTSHYVEFDIKTFPKEIVHIFSSAVISMLNTPGMGMWLPMRNGSQLFMFNPNETYEEVSVEADLMQFGM